MNPDSPDFDERSIFVWLVQKHGDLRVRPARDIDPVGPDGDCWTHAWRYAQERGLRYVEGSVIMTPPEGMEIFVRAHAWCEEDTPFGVIVYEVTEGYEFVSQYQGISVDCSPTGYIALGTKPWDEAGARGSVIENFIMTGWNLEGILQTVKG
jgi:hypothetical protein